MDDIAPENAVGRFPRKLLSMTEGGGSSNASFDILDTAIPRTTKRMGTTYMVTMPSLSRRAWIARFHSIAWNCLHNSAHP